MRVDQIIKEAKPCFSFEFFPPKTDEGYEKLFETVGQLKQLDPAFVSVTYGAMGTTREKTIEIVRRIKDEIGIEAMAHFTCVGASKDELHGVLRQIKEARIENVLALRGDPPEGDAEFKPAPGGLAHANELVDLIVEEYDFCIGGAGYPDVHPEAVDAGTDLKNLNKKVEAGAKFLITQLFFDNESYFDFVFRAREIGIGVPIIPGIMPITNAQQIKRFTKMCGAKIPPDLEKEIEARADDPEACAELGVAYATLQCADLLQRGVPGIHFYTLNRSPATSAIVSALKSARPWRKRGLEGTSKYEAALSMPAE